MACASAPPANVAQPPRPRRETPTRRASERALDARTAEVLRCLPANVSAVRARGRFAGATGRFTLVQLDAADGALSGEVERCVHAALAVAEVPRFRADAHEASFAFERPGAAHTATSTGPTERASRPDVASSAAAPSTVASVDTPPEARVEREHAALTRCFEAERDHTPRLEGGTLELEFTLDAQGQVTRCAHRVLREQGPEGAMSHVGSCVETIARSLSYGARGVPESTHRVTLSFGAEERFAPATDSANR
jgi:hypothetical protein